MFRHSFPRRGAVLFLLSMLVLLSGCATTGSADPRDPLEPVNRSIFSFNEFMDDTLFDHVGKAYNAITPRVVDTGISNMFSNVHDIAVVANDVLQGKFSQAVSDLARLVINSTIGLAGFVDVAADMGLPKHNEDFGQTLATWGLGSGPYLMAPFLGPTTLRDAAGFGVDTTFLNPVSYVGHDGYRAGLMALEYVDVKADLLTAQDILGEAALDRYEFLKHAYLQRRDNLIHDREEAEMDDVFE